jgi:hypothetical protein
MNDPPRVFTATQLRKGQRVLITTSTTPANEPEREEIVRMLQERFPGVLFTVLCGVSGFAVTEVEDGTPGRGRR